MLKPCTAAAAKALIEPLGAVYVTLKSDMVTNRCHATQAASPPPALPITRPASSSSSDVPPAEQQLQSRQGSQSAESSAGLSAQVKRKPPVLGPQSRASPGRPAGTECPVPGFFAGTCSFLSPHRHCVHLGLMLMLSCVERKIKFPD